LIFCEPFAGSAAVTYRLLSRYGKPPISYMGAKTGFADTILACLGLRPGQGAAGVVLGDVGPWAAVHACLGGATGVSAREVAGWVVSACWAFRRGDPESGYNKTPAEGTIIRSADGRVDWMRPATPEKMAAKMPSAAVASIIRSWSNEEPRALWDRLKAEGWPGLLPVEGGRWMGPVDVGEVARWVVVAGGSYVRGIPTGYNTAHMDGSPATATGGPTKPLVERLPNELAAIPTFPPLACWQGRAEDMALPDDLTGWVILADPPYQNTSGYPHGDCDRATVLRLVQGWSDRGAVVAVCEAEPLDLPGWDVVQIDHARVGAKRTFSRQQSEYLTMNRASAHVPPKQVGLFA
jgi:hypothetical protein